MKINKVIDSDVYHNEKYGDYIIVKETPGAVYRYKNNIVINRRCLVRFLDTGYEYEVPYYEAVNCRVRDPYAKRIYGVACAGVVDKSRVKDYRKIYYKWHGIIRSCYSKKCKMYKLYGMNGYSVCDRWLCFEYFLDDLINNNMDDEFIENIGYMSFIKDDSKIFSPESCLWKITSKIVW